jgi:integrase
MASISTDPTGRSRVVFTAADGRRKAISLGGESPRDVERIKAKVEALNAAARSGFAPDEESAAWLRKIGPRLYAKLVKVGLAKPRTAARSNCPTIGDYLDAYIAARGDVSQGTRTSWGVIGARVFAFFGRDRRLEQVAAGDADRFADWLRTEYAPATAAKTIKVARQMFRRAVRDRLIAENPFDDLKAGNERNRERAFFVTRETTQRVIDACPDAEWRLIVALARFGGLRTPSETLSLTWSDVVWGQDRFRVHSPKTRHQGKGERLTPLFPELRRYFEEAFEQAEPGAVHVITRYRDTNANLRTQLLRILAKAGVEPWERLFQNLRASRVTELADGYPLRVVTDWCGNSPNVAHDHYLSTVEEHFQRAATEQGPSRALNSARAPARASLPHAATDEQSGDDGEADSAEKAAYGDVCYLGVDKSVAPHGLEQMQRNPGKTANRRPSAAQSVALPPQLTLSKPSRPATCRRS